MEGGFKIKETGTEFQWEKKWTHQTKPHFVFSSTNTHKTLGWMLVNRTQETNTRWADGRVFYNIIFYGITIATWVAKVQHHSHNMDDFGFTWMCSEIDAFKCKLWKTTCLKYLFCVSEFISKSKFIPYYYFKTVESRLLFKLYIYHLCHVPWLHLDKDYIR